MGKDFLLTYAKLIAQFPDKIAIEEKELGENFKEITLFAHKTDTGRLIGKDGRIINALKAIVVGFKAKDPTSYRVSVKSIE